MQGYLESYQLRKECQINEGPILAHEVNNFCFLMYLSTVYKLTTQKKQQKRNIELR